MKKLALTSLFVLPATALIAIIAATTSAEQDTSAQRPKDADSRAAVAEPSPSEEQPSVASPAADEPATWWEEESVSYPRRRMVNRHLEGKALWVLEGYDEKGRLIHAIHHKDGVQEGPEIQYYPSGKKFCETRFRNGKLDGQAFVWFEDGTVAETVMFEEGVPSGRVAKYYPSGTPRFETDFVRGDRHGMQKLYLPDGRVHKIVQWENDRAIDEQVVHEGTPAERGALRKNGNISLVFTVNFKDLWR